jgi:hypothetical protein
MSLFNYQEDAINHLKEWKVGALFMEAGTGKTRVALELANSVDDVDLILWVGPLSTIRRKDGTSVIDEIKKWGGFKNCNNVMYCGVESISQSDRIFMEVLNAVTSHSSPFIIIDESLKIKNSNAKRTKRLIQIGNKAKYKLILNGTPITKNILDMWAQITFLSPKILNMTLIQYKNTFCNYTTITKSNGIWSRKEEFITGYENLDYLYSLIHSYVYQCDLHLNITQNFHVYNYVIDELAKKDYNEIKETFLNDETLELKNNNIFLEMTQKMQHSYCIVQDKFRAVNEIISISGESNTIIFCKYVISREECERRYPKALVLSYQKESLGLNLQAYNSTIYFDKIWDLALRIQSGRRTFRTGQDLNCQYYDLTGDIGLEKLIDLNIKKKVSMTEYFKKVSRKELEEAL